MQSTKISTGRTNTRVKSYKNNSKFVTACVPDTNICLFCHSESSYNRGMGKALALDSDNNLAQVNA